MSVRTDAEEAVQAVNQMIAIANTKLVKSPVPLKTLYFEQATFVLFADLKANLLGMLSDEERVSLQQKADAYMAQYPQHYVIPSVPRTRRAGIVTRWILRIFIRRQRNYRLIDRLLLATSELQRRLVRRHLKRTGSHLANQSMGLEILFK